MKNGNGGAAAACLSLLLPLLLPGARRADDVGDDADGFTIILLAAFSVRG